MGGSGPGLALADSGWRGGRGVPVWALPYTLLLTWGCYIIVYTLFTTYIEAQCRMYSAASYWGCLCELYLILCLYYTRLLPYTLLLTWGCYFLLCLPPGVLFHTLLLLIEAASLLLYTSWLDPQLQVCTYTEAPLIVALWIYSAASYCGCLCYFILLQRESTAMQLYSVFGVLSILCSTLFCASW